MTISTDRVGLQLMLAIPAAMAMMLALLADTPAANGQPDPRNDGVGVARGYETEDAQTTQQPSPGVPLFCAQVSPTDGDLLYELTGQGTYSSDNGNAIYSTQRHDSDPPALEIKISANGDTGSYYIAPEGTYTTSSCVGGSEVPGQEIDVDISVYAPGSVEDANGNPCDGIGTFSRANTTFNADWELDQDCEVNGNLGELNADGQGNASMERPHKFRGHLTPCLPVACSPLANNNAQLVGSYWQE